ncbi:MAG: hypothetical protein A2W91_15300 [Bacteroidetes bacterium GWF2_38_335]|nr:MAG: hypothetical protein A2W91_15300 [Bacteroidetes bacterium GWF2_38_335]OFY81055.1 MAG: hypothetical protein A2281_13180 [Bacteroidetes bacterium RIFOXYA12_FULL_38_20]HBS87628.1 hypothetical protein [Bacteroidales bacterium]
MNYLVIEGNIGAGKTSLSTRIANDYKAKLVLERFADNPFLPKFYQDPARYSFPLELSFLAERYNQLKKELASLDLFSSMIVSDYYFMKSLIFAANTLADDEYNLYRQLFDIVYSSLPRPDLFVYLHLGTEKLLENIKKRGRNYEQQITADYLEKIQNSYFSYFRQEPGMKILVINTENIDFVLHNKDYLKLTDAIFNRNWKAGINRLEL